jgi:hypothetical protein
MARRRTLNDGAVDMVHALRSRGPEGHALRTWMETWIKGGRELRSCTDLMSELNDELRYYELRVLPAGLTELNEREPPRLWLPEHVISDESQLEISGGRAILVHYSTRGSRPLFARRFAAFVLGPDADRLGRCARLDCSEYFVRTGKRTTYCSTACGRSASAHASMRARRERDHKRRLQLAQQCVRAFRGQWPFDWKQRIARAANTTSHWVTRHVRLGHLPGPSGRSAS